MPRVIQEKFQVNFPAAGDDNGNEWKSDKSAITKKGAPAAGAGLMTLSTPPGSDIADQEYSDQRVMRQVIAGTDDVTDNPSGRDFVKGFVSCPMNQTDDMYTREHNDAFYDDVGGFVERNNMLDRE